MSAPFNIGHDAKVDIVDGSTGQVISTWPPATHFTFTQITSQVKSEPVNDKPIFRETYHGWSGSIDYDRYDAAIDQYFADREKNYWLGMNDTANTITQTVQEKDGSVSQWKYSGVVMKMDTAGSWKSGDKVDIKVSWTARDRVRVL